MVIEAVLAPDAVDQAIAAAALSLQLPELPRPSGRASSSSAVLGREIVAVDDTDTYVCRPHAPGEMAAALVGHRLVATHRRGKFLWVETDGGPELGPAPRHGGPDRGRRAEAPRALGPLLARVRRRRPDGAARQAPPRPGAMLEPDFSHVGPDAAEVGRDAFRARFAPQRRAAQGAAARPGRDRRRRQPARGRDPVARAACTRGGAANDLSVEELDALRRSIRAAMRDAIRQRRRAHRPPEPAPRARRTLPAVRDGAGARDGRRPDDVLVPGVPGPERLRLGRGGALAATPAARAKPPRRGRAASDRLGGLVVRSCRCPASRSVAVERTWPTITLTDRLPVLSRTWVAVAAASARARGPRRRGRVLERSRRSARTAAASSRTASAICGGTFSSSRTARIVPRASTRTLRTARSIRAAAVGVVARRGRGAPPRRRVERRLARHARPPRRSGRSAHRSRARARGPRRRARGRARRSPPRCRRASPPAPRARGRAARRIIATGSAGSRSALTSSATVPPTSASRKRANVTPCGRRLERGHQRRRHGRLRGEHLPAAEEDRERDREHHHERQLRRPRRRSRARAGRRPRSRRATPIAISTARRPRCEIVRPERDDRRHRREERLAGARTPRSRSPTRAPAATPGLQDRPPRDAAAARAASASRPATARPPPRSAARPGRRAGGARGRAGAASAPLILAGGTKLSIPKAQVESEIGNWGRDPTPEAQDRPLRCRRSEGRAPCLPACDGLISLLPRA